MVIVEMLRAVQRDVKALLVTLLDLLYQQVNQLMLLFQRLNNNCTLRSVQTPVVIACIALLLNQWQWLGLDNLL